MSKEKFTKGEWSISHDNDHVGEYINVGMAQLYNSYHDTEQSEQNAHDAHLIAAAPDMYRMLNDMAIYLKSDGNGCFDNTVGVIDKLLAKARGEQNG